MKEKVIKKIKKKFGTISHFALCAGIDRYELQKMLHRSKEGADLQTVSDLIDKTAVGAGVNGIDREKLEKLKSKLVEGGHIIAFCRENPGFSINSVKEIFYGKRKRMSPVVVALFKHFKIK